MSITTTGIQKTENKQIIKLRMWLVHLASLGIFFVPYDHSLLILTAFTFFTRTFAWEGGSHRYFSHHSYKTSRVFQFFLAVLAASGAQRGPIWWAMHHRIHHKYSDTELDLHSPVHNKFLYAHLGWLVDSKNLYTDLDLMRDLSKYPEIVWLNKYHYIFPAILLVLIFSLGEYTTLLGSQVGGISAVIWGFCLSTTLSLQAAFVINSITHGFKPGLFSYRTFKTNDTTTNNWLLAIPTMGASWHNNHHRCMNSAKVGFYWWEIDLTFYILKMLELLGIVWDLKEVPETILKEGITSQNQLSKS
ncbi:MAG: acyl-CoA desaturase [Symploca sp. SIO1C2]|nr:acyl-CoA desaturase [Symploca sp. SIO1C2]